jgi:hypothetical protein
VRHEAKPHQAKCHIERVLVKNQVAEFDGEEPQVAQRVRSQVRSMLLERGPNACKVRIRFHRETESPPDQLLRERKQAPTETCQHNWTKLATFECKGRIDDESPQRLDVHERPKAEKCGQSELGAPTERRVVDVLRDQEQRPQITKAETQQPRPDLANGRRHDNRKSEASRRKNRFGAIAKQQAGRSGHQPCAEPTQHQVERERRIIRIERDREQIGQNYERDSACRERGPRDRVHTTLDQVELP